MVEMQRYAVIFGKNPDISWSEFRTFSSTYNIKIQLIKRGRNWVMVRSTRDLELHFRWLGGALKLIRVMGGEETLEDAHYSRLFTVSLYGRDDWKLWRKLGSTLKRRFKEKGPSKFFKPAKVFSMPSELILKGFPNVRDFDFIFEPDGNVWFGETVAVTDPFELKKLDVGRPVQRPMLSLPPRLARIMVNLTGIREGRFLDPFCGVGTILQEFLLRGIEAHGSDIDERIVRAAEENLEWLRREFKVGGRYELEVRDARNLEGNFTAIVTEPYLGKPLKRPLTVREAKEAAEKLDTFYKEVFKAFADVVDESVVFTFPAFRLRNREIYRKKREWLEEMGFKVTERCLDYEGRHRLIRDVYVLKTRG